MHPLRRMGPAGCGACARCSAGPAPTATAPRVPLPVPARRRRRQPPARPGRGPQARQESAPGGFALAAHVLDAEQHLLAVAPHAERHQQRQPGRALTRRTAPPSRRGRGARHRPAPDRATALPVGLDLVALSPADHVHHDRAAEQRGQRPAYPPRIGSGKICGGDQRLGAPGQPLVGWDRTVAPLRRSAVRPQRDARAAPTRDRPERADQLTLSMAMTMPVRSAAPSISAALQGRFQFRLSAFPR